VCSCEARRDVPLIDAALCALTVTSIPEMAT
jgi:hypothetical protein